jgi:hypothetical protein
MKLNSKDHTKDKTALAMWEEALGKSNSDASTDVNNGKVVARGNKRLTPDQKANAWKKALKA